MMDGRNNRILSYLRGVTSKCSYCSGPMHNVGNICRECWGHHRDVNYRDPLMRTMFLSEAMVREALALPVEALEKGLEDEKGKDEVLQTLYEVTLNWLKTYPRVPKGGQ